MFQHMKAKIMSQILENTNIFSYFTIYMLQLWLPVGMLVNINS